MRSIKLMVAAAVVAAFVAGPVLAQDSGSMAPAPAGTSMDSGSSMGTTTTKPAKKSTHKKSTHKRAAKHKNKSSAPAVTPAPAAQ